MILNPAHRVPDTIRPWQFYEALATAARTTTTQSTPVETPTWARGIQAFLQVTNVPGVDTVTFRITADLPYATNNFIVNSAARVAAGHEWLYLGELAVPPYFTAGAQGCLLPKHYLTVAHSGTGIFIYRAGYLWVP